MDPIEKHVLVATSFVFGAAYDDVVPHLCRNSRSLSHLGRGSHRSQTSSYTARDLHGYAGGWSQIRGEVKEVRTRGRWMEMARYVRVGGGV